MSGLLFLVILPGFVVITMVLALVWQRKAMTTQQRAMSHVEEGLAMSRRNAELLEQMAAMGEESLHNQREMIELLRRLAERRLLDSR